MASSSLGAAGMGPLCALWVVLSLLEAGTGQTLNPPAIAPVLQSFEEDQVRGWEGGGSSRLRALPRVGVQSSHLALTPALLSATPHHGNPSPPTETDPS